LKVVIFAIPFFLSLVLFGRKEDSEFLCQERKVVFFGVGVLGRFLLRVLGLVSVGKDEGEWEVFIFLRAFDGEVLLDLGFDEFVQKIFGSFFEGLLSSKIELLFGSFFAGFIISGIMHFFLIAIKGFEHIFLKIFEKIIFHLIGDFIEKAPDILVSIEVVEEPSEPFVNAHNIVVEIEVSIGEIFLELAGEYADEGGIGLEVVEGEDNLFDVEVDVSVVVLEASGMDEFILALSVFDQDADEDVEVVDDEGDLLADDLGAEVLLDFGGVVKFVDVLAEVGFEGVADGTVLEYFHQVHIAMHLSALADVHVVLALDQVRKQVQHRDEIGELWEDDYELLLVLL
jgi:hypothetical protein